MKNWKDKFNKILKEAMLKKDSLRANVIRMLKTDLINEEIKNNRKDLTKKQVQTVIQRAAKQRKEAMEIFKKVKKMDRAKEEKNELKILEEFLPEQLSKKEVTKIVADTIAKVKPDGMKDFGKVMGAVMGKVKGQADGKIIQDLVKSKLS